MYFYKINKNLFFIFLFLLLSKNLIIAQDYFIEPSEPNFTRGNTNEIFITKDGFWYLLNFGPKLNFEKGPGGKNYFEIFVEDSLKLNWLNFYQCNVDEYSKKTNIDSSFQDNSLRHDVDIINPKATRTFFEIENSIGAKATYYFRYSTIKKNLKFLRKLQIENFEVGYHFEEISTYAKENLIANKETLIGKINEIRNIFVKNINYFKECYATDIKSICSHGDWINGRLNLSNEALVTEKLIGELNLDFEAYQTKLTSLFDVYVSDVADYPQRWSKEISAQSVINNNIKRIYMLTHERFWFTHPFYNTYANLQSLLEQIKFKLGSCLKKRQVSQKKA